MLTVEDGKYRLYDTADEQFSEFNNRDIKPGQKEYYVKSTQNESGTSLFTNEKRLFQTSPTGAIRQVRLEGALAQSQFLDVFDGEDYQIALVTQRSKNEVYVVGRGK